MRGQLTIVGAGDVKIFTFFQTHNPRVVHSGTNVYRQQLTQVRVVIDKLINSNNNALLCKHVYEKNRQIHGRRVPVPPRAGVTAARRCDPAGFRSRSESSHHLPGEAL
jgi:DNA topoisomerase VI subunit B